MDKTHAEIAARIRMRAFRSRDPRAALKLLALAEEVPSMRFPNASRVLLHLKYEQRRVGETPQLRQLRKKKRWLDVARPLTRHPRILSDLADLLPRARGRPGADLRTDLMMDDTEIEALRIAAEEAFGVFIDRRAPDEWETLNDVTDSIAAQLATEAA
jgi:hypothetical protein